MVDTDYRTPSIKRDSRTDECVQRALDDSDELENYSQAARFLIRQGAQKLQLEAQE